jgi:hypothetical protein
MRVARGGRSDAGGRTWRRRLAGWALRGAGLLAVAAAPFVILVRGALWAHGGGWNAWLAMLLGMALASVALAAITSALWHRLTGRRRLRAIATRVALPAVVGFSLYGVAVFRANAVDARVAELYGRLHPALRLGVATVCLVDPSLVVTDAARRPDDYPGMGLATEPNSRHYQQADGWVHAVDLRTRGRSTFRNLGVRSALVILGFETLRHDGTADHLHVSLPESA